MEQYAYFMCCTLIIPQNKDESRIGRNKHSTFVQIFQHEYFSGFRPF